MVQQVKDLALSLWGLGSLLRHGFDLQLSQWIKDLMLPQLWLGFDPWLGKLHLLQVWPKKKKKMQLPCRNLLDTRSEGNEAHVLKFFNFIHRRIQS